MALGQSVSSNRGLVEAGPPFLKVKFMLICSLIYRQISNFAIMKPQIAIITGNTLEAIGLESIVRKMMPKADVLLLPSAATRAGSTRRNAANLAADAARNGGVAPCCIRLTQ